MIVFRTKRAQIAAQLVGTWLVGAFVLPMAWPLVVLAGFVGGVVGIGLVALVGVLAVAAYLLTVVSATGEVSVLGSTRGSRVLWALLVLGVGSAVWGLAWAVTDDVGIGLSRSRLLTAVLGGVPFALVAGALLRGRRFVAAALGLSAVLAVTGVAVLRHVPPDELEARLAADGMHLDTAYIVAIPGYVSIGTHAYGGGLGDSTFVPANQDAIPPNRYIAIVAHSRMLPNGRMCGQPTAQDSQLGMGDCEVEPGGLVYRHNEINHGYQVLVGEVPVTVVGTPAVGHDLLQTAARTLRPATPEELGPFKQNGAYFAVDVPGYRGQVTGTPPGMSYEPADNTGNGYLAVSIRLQVSVVNDQSVCFTTTECVAAGDGLTYVRHEEDHGYILRRGSVNVWMLGGLLVDRALLRQAALGARPATMEELDRAVPPLPSHGFVDRLRQLLRRFP